MGNEVAPWSLCPRPTLIASGWGFEVEGRGRNSFWAPSSSRGGPLVIPSPGNKNAPKSHQPPCPNEGTEAGHGVAAGRTEATTPAEFVPLLGRWGDSTLEAWTRPLATGLLRRGHREPFSAPGTQCATLSAGNPWRSRPSARAAATPLAWEPDHSRFRGGELVLWCPGVRLSIRTSSSGCFSRTYAKHTYVRRDEEEGAGGGGIIVQPARESTS
jgi:hypothetical protein